MFYIAKLARRLARLRLSLTTLPMLSLLCLVGACAAGEPTGISTDSPSLPDAPVVLSPQVMTLEGTQQVLFRAYEADLTTQVTSIEWTASGGSIAGDGTYSSSTTGNFRVVGKRVGNPHNLPDTSTVIVVPVQTTLASVVVSPSGASVIGGQRQQYTAAGLMSDGSTVAIGVTWSATGGTIDVGGLFMAGNTGGTFQVIATHVTTGIADTVPVTVRAVQSIALSPTSASLSTGGTRQFAVTGTLSDGSTASLTTVGYSASGGTISANGLYTAPLTAGSYTVKAQLAPGTGTGPSANAAVSVVATTSAQPGTYPHLPAGLSLLFQYDGNGLPGGGGTTLSATNMAAGVGSFYAYWSGAATNPTASDAPGGSSQVYDLLYPAGLGGGNSSAIYKMWSSPSWPQMTEYYEAGLLRIGGSSFEGPGSTGQWKILGYWAVGQAPGGYGAQIFGLAAPVNVVGTTTAGQIATTWKLGILAQNQVTWAVWSSSTSLLIQCGKWYRYEIHMVLDNPAGASNGVLEVWLTNVTDGGAPVKIISQTDRPYRSSTATAGFWARWYDPVWGGGSPSPKTRNDHLQVAQMTGFGR
jgi:hypothetical protein